MNRSSLLIALTSGAVLLAACVKVGESAPPLVVNVKRDGDGCRISIEGERVTSDRISEVGRGAKTRRAIVVYHKDTPYKCIGEAIYTLQRAGLVFVDAAMWDDS